MACLNLLKGIIESNLKEIRDGMNNCWNEEKYKEFVLKLLGRATQGAPSEGDPHPSYNAGKRIAVSDAVSDVTSDGTSTQDSIPFAPDKQPVAGSDGQTKQQSSKTDRMSDVFCRAIEGFRVVEFIETNPFDGLSAALLWDVSRVVGQIKDQSSSETDPDRSTETYKHITEFSAVLKTYLRFLGSNSTNPEFFPDGFYLVYSDSEEFKAQVEWYRSKLRALLEAINSEIERERSKQLKERYAEIGALKVRTYQHLTEK